MPSAGYSPVHARCCARKLTQLLFFFSFCLLIRRVVGCAGPRGHILNLGHGVLVRTPEEAVAHFFDVVRGLRYETLFRDSAAKEFEPVA